MVPLKQLFSSTLGRKYIMGASGFALVLFIIVHLLGNLTLYSHTGDSFNAYAAKLAGLGVLLLVAEVGLAAVILIHVWAAIQVTLRNKSARPIAYAVERSKNGPSKSTAGSRNMWITGAVLFLFLCIHIYQFRFGPDVAEGYTSTVNGVMVRDLFRLVVETFVQIKWVIFYVSCMVFLGFHFRHGFWSAFQSLGILNPRWSKPIYALGFILALIFSAAFLFIPIYIYATQSGGGNS